MTATACTNGKPQRRQLADQLDRLDAIIDALSEGLNGAVADACREGTRLAVKDAVVEILTNPELRAMLTNLTPPAPAPQPPAPSAGRWARLKAAVAAAKGAATGLVARTKTAAAAATGAVSVLGAITGEALPARRVLVVAAGVGLLAWLVCQLMPESATAVFAGTGWAAAALLVQTGAWIRRAARRLGLPV